MYPKTDTHQPLAQPAAAPTTWHDFSLIDASSRTWGVYDLSPRARARVNWSVHERPGQLGFIEYNVCADGRIRSTWPTRGDAEAEIVEASKTIQVSELVDPKSAPWLLVEDTAETSPVDLASDDERHAWATEYRARRLPDALRHLGMVVGLTPAKPPVLALWLGIEESAATLRSWIKRTGGDDEDGARFTVLRQAHAREWAAVNPTRAAAPRRKGAFALHTTGIAPLDGLLATNGIPRGARVYVQAATGQGKSVFDLQIAEHFAASGLRVVWIATSDESIESINARRLQRIGYERGEALACALAGDADALGKLNPNLEVVDGRTTYLEDVIATAPDLLVLDPVQKVRARAGEGAGELERIGAVVRVAEQSGITLLAASSKVRGAGKRAKIEGALGGAFIENGATLLLDLALDGTTLRATVLKSRYGGEHETVELALDRDCQRLAAPGNSDNVRSVSEADANRHAQILAVLERGPKTARALRQWVAGAAQQVRVALDELESAGKIVKIDGEYSIPK